MSAIKLRMLYKKEFGVHPFIDAYSPKLNYACWLERKLRKAIKAVPVQHTTGRYATALSIFNEWRGSLPSDSVGPSFVDYCQSRLNAGNVAKSENGRRK